MSNVLVDKNKIDILANAISAKSGEPVTMTLAEMVEAVDGIDTSGGGITPTGNINITGAGVTDVTNYATATVPSAEVALNTQTEYYTDSGTRKWRHRAFADTDGNNGWYEGGTGNWVTLNAVPSGTTVTPTTSAQTIGDRNYMMEGAVTVEAMPTGTAGTPTATKGTVSNHAVSVTPSVTNSAGYISGGTKTGTAVSVSASELVSGTLSVTSSGTKDVTNYASASIPEGTAGTPTATKGAVSNHSVSVTPSVTNQTGFITGSTINGTAVSVSASELVSGSQTLSDNGDYDVTNLASVTVAVSGGGGALTVGTKTTTLSAAASSISFTGLSGNPTSFVVTSSADQTTGGTKVVAVAWDGSDFNGMDVTTQAAADTGFSKSYSSGTLTITATSAQFQANEYKLVYTYGGSSSDIHTADVQVGSGATSITFTSLSGNPAYFSCVFKSDFSTSSGYQRVMDVVYDGTNTYGHAFDSEANAQTSWSHSYSGGSLTISSQGTNNGGYFHQPGYYQLTYAVDPNALNLQQKTNIGASTSSQTITADNGYDGLESVQINAVSQTNLTAANIKDGTTISISNGSTNLWSVTGTYTGGTSSKNVQVVQGTTRTTSTSMTAIGSEMTVSKTGTYDVYWSAFRSNTSSSYTYATQLYIGGSAYGSENTTWSNHVQNNHLSNVSLTLNQKIRVYGRESRGSSYYVYAPTLVIVEA